ncbi:N-6 DNA methylase [Catellatospora sichuanensis]|uniref:N-6 DNA methylase n=1 Tax=Catellatospora sichuanensis TaxID=1969805 RepID=UPI00118283D6|nr:N-6 DNA methylase [Catellatospora sichuanensis]
MTPAETATPDSATVAAYDIARLAGVGKAAVSNWRRRYPDFPKPVGGTATSPLYLLSDVEAWLTEHGRTFEVQPADRVWQQIRGTIDDLQLGDLLGCVGAVLTLRERSSRTWQSLAKLPDRDLSRRLTPAIREHLPELPGSLPQTWDDAWLTVVRATTEAAHHQDARQVFEFLYSRYAEVHSRRLSTTAGPLAELMVAFAGMGHGAVADPACGTGGLLLAARAAGATRLLGQEVDGVLAQIAAARLMLADTPARVAVGDTLTADAFTGEIVDAIVCDPPFAERAWGYEELVNDPRWEYGLPPRGESELAWVQHCLARVKPGGYAVVLMPAAAANRRAGRRIRSNLLRSGALRAVIAAGGSTTVAAPQDLWVLQRPSPQQPPRSHLLLVDMADDAAAARAAWETFCADPAAMMPAGALAVPVIDLLDEDVDVGPRRRVVRAGPSAHDMHFAEVRAALADTLQRLPASLPALTSAVEALPSATATLAELAKTGMVSIHQAPLKTSEDGPDTLLNARDVRRGTEPSGRGIAMPGSVIIRPDDVVISLSSREPAARVVAAGGALLGPQLLLVRVDKQRLDPYFLAGFLLAALREPAARGAGSSSRSDAYRLAVPRLTLAEQRPYGAAFKQLMAFEDTLHEATSRAHELLRLGFAGLTAGSLEPPNAG